MLQANPGADFDTGSGVIITDDGYIVTNNHVVQGADTIHVYLQDGTKYDAELIGTDTFSDLAIVKIDVAIAAATIGSSGNVTVGDTVYAMAILWACSQVQSQRASSAALTGPLP